MCPNLRKVGAFLNLYSTSVDFSSCLIRIAYYKVNGSLHFPLFSRGPCRFSQHSVASCNCPCSLVSHFFNHFRRVSRKMAYEPYCTKNFVAACFHPHCLVRLVIFGKRNFTRTTFFLLLPGSEEVGFVLILIFRAWLSNIIQRFEVYICCRVFLSSTSLICLWLNLDSRCCRGISIRHSLISLRQCRPVHFPDSIVAMSFWIFTPAFDTQIVSGVICATYSYTGLMMALKSLIHISVLYPLLVMLRYSWAALLHLHFQIVPVVYRQEFPSHRWSCRDIQRCVVFEFPRSPIKWGFRSCDSGNDRALLSRPGHSINLCPFGALIEHFLQLVYLLWTSLLLAM